MAATPSVHYRRMDGQHWMASAMRAARAQLEIATHNLANASTDGFRRTTGATRIAHDGLSVFERTVREQGAIRSTGRRFDLALLGEGTFAVGTTRTREGAFTRDHDGFLTDDRGRRLHGTHADVAGFKCAAATFADVRAGAIGLGTIGVGRHAVFAQGKLVRSGGAFDLAIDGAGFFAVERGGAKAYTRNGEFAREADGSLRNTAGWTLSGVRIPDDALSVRVERDGRVIVDTPARKGRTIAQLRLASFPSPEALRPLGATLFAATEASGRAHAFAPGARGLMPPWPRTASH